MGNRSESKTPLRKKAPLSSDKENEDWLSGLMPTMLLMLIISSALIFLSALIATPPHLSLLNRSTALAGMTLGFFLSMYPLLKLGYHRQSATLSSIYLILFTTYTIYSGWGLHDMVLAMYPVLFLIASLLLSRIHFIALTVLTLGLVLAIGLAEIQGILINKTSYLTGQFDIALIIIILACTAVLVRLLSEKLISTLAGARKNATNYKEIFNTSNDAIFIIDPVSYAVEDINLAAERMFGITADNPSAADFRDITSGVPPYTVAAGFQFLESFIQNGSQLTEWQVKDYSGSVLWVEVSLESITLNASELIMVVLRDISLRKKAEEESLYLQNYLKNVIDSMPSVIIGVDAEVKITRWNKKAEDATQLQANNVKGKSLNDVVPQLKNDIDKVNQAIKNHEVLRVHIESNDDKTFGEYIDVTIFPLMAETMEGAVIRIDDVTQNRRNREVMIQTEKMMSVGGLAAGMAHEINNPLGAMMQSAQNIQRRLSPELSKNVDIADEVGLDLNLLQPYLDKREINAFIDGIRDAGTRAAKIISNMLQFSRKSESNMVPIQLNQLIDQTIELAYNDYDLKKRFDFRHIELLRTYNPKMPLVPCNETEIEQVILNLLKNASQAIFENPSDNTPCIEILTDFNNNQVIIEVTDNGPGIPFEIQHQVFEPFFTTKPVGEGTGLGLSVSYMIITQNHRGSMVLHSQPGNGSRFIITLPL